MVINKFNKFNDWFFNFRITNSSTAKFIFMNHFFFMQVNFDGQIPYYVHIIIVGAIMICAGLLGGQAGYLLEKNRTIRSDSLASAEENIKKQRVYFLVTGVCAALLIPLFLSTISSQLMTESQKEPLKYFVFGGFCLLVAIFSKRFISTLSDKILKEVKEEVQQQTKEKVEKAFDEKKGFISDQVQQQVTLQTAPLQNKLSVIDELTKLESRIKNPNNPTPLQLEDLTDLLDQAIQTGDPNLPSQVYDKVSLFCYDLKRDDLLEKINELYKDKIKLTPTAWADLSVSYMNKYSRTKNPVYKTKAEEYIDQSLLVLPDYGVAYSFRIYLLLIEYEIIGKDNPKANELVEKMKDIFRQISNLGKITIKEAYNYFGLNDTTSFSKYNTLLKTLLPEEWKALEQNSQPTTQLL